MKRFKNILYIAETNNGNDLALERAITLANENDADLTAVNIAEKVPHEFSFFGRSVASEDIQKKLTIESQKALDDLVAPWIQIKEIQTEVLTGVPFLEIIQKVLRDGHDLVIKSTESKPSDWLFSSNDMHLLRKCPCPVWLVKPNSAKANRTIVAAVDASDFYPQKELLSRQSLNCQILEMSMSLAASESSKLHIVHVWDVASEDVLRGSAGLPEKEVASFVNEVKQHHKNNVDSLVETAVTKLEQESLENVELKINLLKGTAQKEIPAFSKKVDADLIIMGTVARTGVPGFFMGNTAENILRHISCSVLAIKPEEFVTPIILKS